MCVFICGACVLKKKKKAEKSVFHIMGGCAAIHLGGNCQNNISFFWSTKTHRNHTADSKDLHGETFVMSGNHTVQIKGVFRNRQLRTRSSVGYSNEKVKLISRIVYTKKKKVQYTEVDSL